MQVSPPSDQELSIGFVDWNVDPPDRNMGIFREVSLHFNGGISIENPFVETKINPDNSKHAILTVSSELVNHSAKLTTGTLNVVFKDIHLNKPALFPQLYCYSAIAVSRMLYI